MRDELDAAGLTLNGSLADELVCPDRYKVTVAGLVLIRQRPGTASDTIFMTIEDEFDVANLVVWPKVFKRYHSLARHANALVCTG